MIIAINYADDGFAKAQKFNLETAVKWGADRVIGYGPADIDDEFRRRNREILKEKKGNGLYLWKPYFLNKAYSLLGDGDYLIYTDAGSIYVNKIQYLIDAMEQEGVDLMVFSLEKDMLERKYNKRDAFILMGCDSPEYTDTPQTIGGYVLMKKSGFVEGFLKEDLEYAQDIRIIGEGENTQGMPDYPDFVAHRHDQAVWSLMVKKYGLKRFRDPSQFGMCNCYEREVEQRSSYPQIIDSHRMNVGSYGELKWKRSLLGKTAKRVYGKITGMSRKHGG